MSFSKNPEDLRADIARLEAHIAEFRRLAEARQAAGDEVIAQKLLDTAAQLQRQADELQQALNGQVNTVR